MAQRKRRSNSGKQAYGKGRNDRCKDGRKSRYMDSDKPEGYQSTNGSNDISWYSRNPELLVAAGNFPYPYRPGMEMDFGSTAGILKDDSTIIFTENKFKIPGICTIHWIPTFGHSENQTDPASIAGKEIYAKVRKAYSGQLDADAPDFVLYLQCLDSIYAYLAWLKRVYRTLNVWTPENYTLPDELLKCMGLSSTAIKSLRGNMTNFWQCINELVLMSRKFTCPMLMDVMNRHYWMSDNVYTDSDALNSQFFLFNPDGFYMYKEMDDPNGTSIKVPGAQFQPIYTSLFSTADGAVVDVGRFYAFGRQLIDALVAWDDSYTINGYLARAYEGVPQFVVEELPQIETFTPKYNEEVLTQIENVQTLPASLGRYLYLSPTGGSALRWLDVSQDPVTNSYLSLKPFTVSFGTSPISGVDVWLNSATDQYYGWEHKPYISSRSMSPQVADNVIATRLKNRVRLEPTANAGVYTVKVLCATEIVTRITMSSNNTIPIPTDLTLSMWTGNTPDGDLLIKSITHLTNCDWHPLLRMLYSQGGVPATGPATKSMEEYFIGDIHNLTMISYDDLENLHKVCVYSELNAFMA